MEYLDSTDDQPYMECLAEDGKSNNWRSYKNSSDDESKSKSSKDLTDQHLITQI